MTTLDAIKARDATWPVFVQNEPQADDCDSTQTLARDRRWLLGVVEQLGSALSCYVAHHASEAWPDKCDCSDCRSAKEALALLTEEQSTVTP